MSIVKGQVPTVNRNVQMDCKLVPKFIDRLVDRQGHTLRGLELSKE